MNSKSRRILLVEDHTDSAAVLSKVLQARGHTVVTAGTCALARAAFKSAIFDVAVIDIGLPDGDGYGLLSDLRAIRVVPAVAITGYGMPQDISRSQAAGFIAHIIKPIVLPGLDEVISNLRIDPAAA